MTTFHHCIVIYPISGLKRKSTRYNLFVRLVDKCLESSNESKPVIVYDEMCKDKEEAPVILKLLEDKGCQIARLWGVDTCQDWLAGWGFVFDYKINSPLTEHRLILLPGDIEKVEDHDQLFENLSSFIKLDTTPLIVGDFDSIDRRSPKELIDTYGVYPLVANWFPEAWHLICQIKLKKPRSEFLNIRADLLQILLGNRVFAYEQTLNMLILLWYEFLKKAKERNFSQQNQSKYANQEWLNNVSVKSLGKFSDDPSSRHYRGIIDQIERTERMLRMLWRAVKEWNLDSPRKDFSEFVNEYESLNRRSTIIRDAARVGIWAQLGFKD